MEIKKAFEQMKKEIKKETGISYGFSMSAKQQKNRTATFCACNDIPYDDEIERAENSDKKVQTYTSWTEKEKANCHERTVIEVNKYKARKAKYGTKQNEAEALKEQIVNSNAFKRFCEAVGPVSTAIEINGGVYYVRFCY